MTDPRWDPTAGEQPAPPGRDPPWEWTPVSDGTPPLGTPSARRGDAPSGARLLSARPPVFSDQLIEMPLTAEQQAELKGVFLFFPPGPPVGRGGLPALGSGLVPQVRRELGGSISSRCGRPRSSGD